MLSIMSFLLPQSSIALCSVFSSIFDNRLDTSCRESDLLPFFSMIFAHCILNSDTFGQYPAASALEEVR